jgi:hypothetical protein
MRAQSNIVCSYRLSNDGARPLKLTVSSLGSYVMLKYLTMLALAVGTVVSADAASLKATFGGGILGVAWSTSLTDVVGIYPLGDHMFALTPGCRAYWVKDGQTYLGVPRDRNGVLFGFDRKNHIVVAAVAFDFERKDELRATLTGLLGAPLVATQSTEKTQYAWRSSEGMTAAVTEFGEGSQRIVWLSVALPGYKSVRDGC